VVAGWWYFPNPSNHGKDAIVLDCSALIRPYSPSEGRADAAVVIVEFFDPACGTCHTSNSMVKQLFSEHPGRIRLVMRCAPFHKGYDKVVAVLEAARRQGMSWQVIKALFDSQDDWAPNQTAKVDLAWKHLKGIGLNIEQHTFDMTVPALQKAAAQDLTDANTPGVSQTPEYFVNGRPLPSLVFPTSAVGGL
jgi:protein-disulfide isomerase